MSKIKQLKAAELVIVGFDIPDPKKVKKRNFQKMKDF